MTRIIAGFAGSLTLRVPRSGTRPTSDRVREAVFSALEARDALDGATVVDLYAGSGALGLESASRGASSVVLVEREARAARTAGENARAILASAAANTVLRPRIEVVTASVRSFLDSSPALRVDTVFLDPPYDLGEEELASDLAGVMPLLREDAVVVVERSSRSPEPRWPGGLERERRKDYGETTIWWASPVSAADD
ncbi:MULTISPECIES: 16S rRNA (guanine(966)-N(2))-methyltransferase RsmD [unclassified Rathayibacter]|uniref:16S rRNA (guanine(966)-N(2))-methyltransferase RsmD n=1 Tax=unclassified Rathayibacter TaxID=2609250 RepID=UPI00188AF696|nr:MULTISPECIES: 16S rRNA (guanine(966)-N(2))-methyltransferase RsmD [unclassified Rathayibacter]MBF4462013.1 16S rRNA (guanine(966)-N(2))-methyltransferase RsmD [Rathayibacter sp. VKM Ac-2879]MBF4503944.1 16S rRNA (guanine(966)-N(2))-methyltransferase RsmD [Rathayibacter sp. VKM Ac-2878]